MAKKLTYEEVKEYIESQGYKLLSKEYVNNNTKLILKDVDGYLYVTTWGNFNSGKIPRMVDINNPYSLQNIKVYALQFGYELLSTEYINSRDKLLFKCPTCKEIIQISWTNFKLGKRCPYCCNSPKKIKLGVNTIWDTDKWMVDLGVSEEDAKIYSRCSGKKIIVTCPYCGEKKEITIYKIYTKKSIGCSCSDGISYSEKFIISILNQLNINYIKEYSPSWCNNKRYDFYLEDYNCIIECHGMQHYNNGFDTCGGRTLTEERENDKLKKDLALNNDILNYIILDCRYSKLEYIKNSILSSELNNLFNLDNINWLQCEEYALSNKIKQICDYWKEHNEINNEELTTDDIGKVFNLNKATIINYLNKGSKLGWCNYDSQNEYIKGVRKKNKNGKKVEIFKNGKSLGVFESCTELERQSEKLFGVKLNYKSISAVCNGKRNHHKDFTFKYVN